MGRVLGRVVEEETNRGVADAIIVVYDIDAAGRANVAANRWSDVLGSPRAGDRLGSTATDGRGEFALDYTQRDLGAGDPEGRADLALVVLAAESAVQGSIVGQPEHQRILRVSMTPRPNAGSTETYVIRIPRARLSEFSMTPRRPEATLAVGAAAKSMQTALSESSAKGLRQLLATRVSARGKARELTGKWTTVPKNTLGSFFVSPGQDEGEVVAAATTAGLERLAAYAASVGPLMRVDIPASLLARWDIDPHALPAAGLPVESACRLVPGAGLKLERTRELLSALADADAADASDGTGSGGGSGGSGDIVLPTPVSADDLEEEIRRQLMGTLKQNTTTAASDLLTPVERANRAVAGLARPNGPSDVPAYHDFHSLQLALPSVWVEAFDKGARGVAERLYAETVRLDEDYGIAPRLLDEFEDVERLRDFLSELDDDIESLEIEAVPAQVRALWPDVTDLQWSRLPKEVRTELALAAIVNAFGGGRDDAVERGQARIDAAAGTSATSRFESLISELRSRLGEPHAFHYFAPGSINFGLLTTYRQRWEPEAYQVGDLVSTIPLAPRESREIRTTSRSSEERDVSERTLSSSRSSSSINEAQRAREQVLRRTSSSTNFKSTVSGSVNFGIGSIGGATGFGLDQSSLSQSTKDALRETTARAAQAVRREHVLQVETATSFSAENETTGRIENPNDEITVTYLLYALERRYQVSTKLQRLTPTVLVGQAVPRPDEIDDDWLLANEVALRKVVLDQTLASAFELIRTHLSGKAAGIEIKRAVWSSQLEVVKQLRSSVDDAQNVTFELQELLADTSLAQGVSESEDPDDLELAGAAIASGGLSLLFGTDSADSERLEAQRKAYELRLDQSVARLRDLRARLERETSAFERATSQYTQAIEEQFDARTRVDQLRVYCKKNILPCMQSIWAHEPPDQRFFRLYHQRTEVPVAPTCRLRRATAADRDRGFPIVDRAGDSFVIECPAPTTSETREIALGDLADLDRPLGFKGNYMIFPLRQCTAITDHMMHEYVDGYFGIRDPDTFSEFSTAELERYVGVIRARDDLDPILKDSVVEQVQAILAERLSGHASDTERVVLPTGQLFIEALPGAHAVLEPFKQTHRALDVAGASADVLSSDLERLRLTLRLARGEMGDPDIDKQIVVHGTNGIDVETS